LARVGIIFSSGELVGLGFPSRELAGLGIASRGLTGLGIASRGLVGVGITFSPGRLALLSCITFPSELGLGYKLLAMILKFKTR
jgi:hypothetical protein